MSERSRDDIRRSDRRSHSLRRGPQCHRHRRPAAGRDPPGSVEPCTRRPYWRPEAEGAGRRHVRELGQGASGSEFHDSRSRRSENRSAGDDQKHKWFDRRRNPEYPRRQADNLCPQTDGATNVPVAAVCRSSTDLGGTFIAKAPNASQGVAITIVYASHSNNVPLALLSEAQRATLSADGAGLEFGPPTGFVIKFTNGLTAYLSGDTGIHSEMKTVVTSTTKQTSQCSISDRTRGP